MMISNQNNLMAWPLRGHAQKGFTLIELMVGLVVGSIVAIGVFSTYHTNQRSVMVQRQVADMQQQLRGSLYIMERDVRAAGFDPRKVGTPDTLGITDVRRYNIAAEPAVPADDAAGSPTLEITYDIDEDGVLDQVAYLLYDIDADGIVDIVRRTAGAGGPNYGLLAEGMEAIGFAYAYDDDGDGNIDTDAGGNTLWAVDSDNDNVLDRLLDADNDGDIDLDDDIDGDNVLNDAGAAVSVDLENIRMVRMWFLCRTNQQVRKGVQNVTAARYLVGDRIITPGNDNIYRRTTVVTVTIRNKGLVSI
jgi:type IV pilus assembly protein PilW